MKRALSLVALVAACAGGEIDSAPREVAPDFGSPRVAVDSDPRPDVVRVSLRAALLAPFRGAEALGYDGAIPGPTIRAKVGDTVEVELDNQLTTPTTIHFHGVHLPYEMDGDGHGRDPVLAGERFVYSFVADRAGTFWYHPHVGGAAQVRAGLYGAFVVEDPADEAAEEVVLVFSEVPGEAVDPPAHAHALPLGAYRRGQSWLVNGVVTPVLPLPSGRVVRARIINASSDAPLRLSWPNVRVIGTDQGLLAQPVSTDALSLMPGDRAEVEWLIGADSFDVLALPDSSYGPLSGDAVGVLRVAPRGALPAPEPRAWRGPTLPAIESLLPVDAVWTFTGAGAGSDFRINGERYPDVTPTRAPLGAPFVIELHNLSSSRHPFHLHGHPFRVLLVHGSPPVFEVPEFDSLEDTIALEPFSTRRILVRPDHPGEWLAHCHFLTHEAAGMVTVLSVR